MTRFICNLHRLISLQSCQSHCCFLVFLQYHTNKMSLVMRKRAFAYAKTKTQISFAVTAKLISAFVFATLIVQIIYFLNPKFQAYSHLMWLYSPVCVGPGRKPRRPVFSQRGSNQYGLTGQHRSEEQDNQGMHSFQSHQHLFLKAYSGNDREQDLGAYEGKQLRMYQETPFYVFFIYVMVQDIFSV